MYICYQKKFQFIPIYFPSMVYKLNLFLNCVSIFEFNFKFNIRYLYTTLTTLYFFYDHVNGEYKTNCFLNIKYYILNYNIILHYI